MEIKIDLDGPILKSGIKKKVIAKKLGVDPNTLSGWISGKRKIPFDKAIHLTIIIGCKLSDLFEVKNQPPQA